MNVIGSRPDGWWRDRPGAQRRLYERLAAAQHAADVMVVFEGEPQPELDEGSARTPAVRWARRRGRDAADDRIVEETRTARAAGREVTVVTSDRALRDRVEHLGATTVGPSGLHVVLSAGS
jgi:predicted RNA-binding protein with PIN domain